ncbi:unnamed protein product [Caenorhabditis angaria]|uniref:Fork-head domain-containing protein n=1 Tax=Caenorhabditis angaria TaxID=860376 RepID=A0A9P1MS70_9PELO|nr:unnamed protein product [Caenorhabditis angaria]
MHRFSISELCPELCQESTSEGSMPSTPEYSSGDENTPKRPNISYSAMIMMAIRKHPEKRLTITEIYDYITDTYPYYAISNNRWRNSVRHTLSARNCFVRCQKDYASGTKGCHWTIKADETANVCNGKLVTKRANRNQEKWLKSLPNPYFNKISL